MRAFSPGATSSIAVSGTTGRVIVGNRNGATQVRIYNSGANCFIKAGDSTVEATTSDLPVPSGSVEVLTFAPGADGALYIAAIGTSGTIYFTIGEGV